mgnify:CR=1 FL=1
MPIASFKSHTGAPLDIYDCLFHHHLHQVELTIWIKKRNNEFHIMYQKNSQAIQNLINLDMSRSNKSIDVLII